ncbi:gastrula zinc finger protein XlCGF57.1-like isoform X2 [Pseudoliparis swirei]|uniref:gastrula zinc finger protein XlCGF57.1-like isoform X2 n=1 Tax=Pseudoliparis swirei TaxID=2059687 RepID=UPI0024BE2EA7|nr:gastrula zinc finger protein XlCGF57.1-like isoform X2 [Pseudoliparis swirei]
MPAGDFLLGTDVLLGGSSYGRVAPPLRFRNTGVLGPDSCCLDAIREFWMERRSRGVRWLRGKDVVGVLHSDVQKVIVKEEQDFSLDQEDQDPPHIKEEQEDLWTNQEGAQLEGLEEAGTRFSFSPVKSDEEEAQSSHLHQRLTEHMEPEPDWNLSPDRHFQRSMSDNVSQGNERVTDDDDDDDWRETIEPPSGSNSLNNEDLSVCESRCRVGEKPFDCSECGKRFGTKAYLKVHVRTDTGEKPFSCSVCGKGFTRKVLLQLHIKSHTGEKPFSCSVCGKGFTQAGSLTRHMPLHTGEKRFSCSVCTRRFTWYTSLKTHRCVGYRSEENREEEPPAGSSTGSEDGEDCGGSEPDQSGPEPDAVAKTGDSSDTDDSDDEWKKTRESQSGPNSPDESVSDSRCGTCEKPFSCSHCGKRFGFKAHLKRHMRSHNGEKPFSCLFCRKSFAQSDSLQKHMRIHTGEKPYSCSLCGKAFSEIGNLKVHMRSHTGEKPFSCSLCKKSFTKSDSLQKHMRIHTGEKPFCCSVCGKSFSESGNLKRHLRLHTEKPSSAAEGR